MVWGHALGYDKCYKEKVEPIARIAKNLINTHPDCKYGTETSLYDIHKVRMN